MEFQRMNVRFFLLWLLLFTGRSYAPDSSYGTSASLLGLGIISINQWLKSGNENSYWKGGNWLSRESSAARQQKRVNLHVVSVSSGALHSTEITLPAPPGKILPETANGADTVSNS